MNIKTLNQNPMIKAYELVYGAWAGVNWSKKVESRNLSKFSNEFLLSVLGKLNNGFTLIAVDGYEGVIIDNKFNYLDGTEEAILGLIGLKETKEFGNEYKNFDVLHLSENGVITKIF